MEIENEENLEHEIPIEAVCDVLDHYWKTEIENFRRAATSDHIFHALAELANSCLFLRRGWSAAEYLAISDMMPEMSWNVGLFALKYVRPGELNLMDAADGDATWAAVGPMSYRLQGHKPTVQVVVGWDGPLSTFFAQVWEVPEGEPCYMEGDLLLWLGLGPPAIQDISELTKALAPFVTLPEKLGHKLVEHAVFGA